MSPQPEFHSSPPEETPKMPRDPLADYRLSPEEMTSRPAAPQPNAPRIVGDTSPRPYAPAIPAVGQLPITPTANVWPPPPGGVDMGATPAEILGIDPGQFRSVMTFSRILIGLLSSVIAFCCLVAGVVATHAMTADNILGLVVIEALLFLTTGVFFCVFTGRAYGNLKVFQAGGLSTTSSGAAWSFVIPIVNLYKPLTVYQEIWQASDPELQIGVPFAWQRASKSSLVPVWWASFIVLNVSSRTLRYGGEFNEYGTLFHALIELISGVLAIAVVNGVAVRQEEKHSILEQRLAAQGMPYTPPRQ